MPRVRIDDQSRRAIETVLFIAIKAVPSQHDLQRYGMHARKALADELDAVNPRLDIVRFLRRLISFLDRVERNFYR